MNLEEIIRGCKRRDAYCQKRLVELYSDQLYAICLRYMGDRQKAWDVLQDSFMAILKYINGYDKQKGTLEAWVRRITINQALRHLKKKKLHIVYQSDETFEQKGMAAEAINKLNTEDILRLVQELPEGYRQIFNLSVIEGYTHQEIAELLNIQPVTSRANLSKAKKILRKKIIEQKKPSAWERVM